MSTSGLARPDFNAPAGRRSPVAGNIRGLPVSLHFTCRLCYGFLLPVDVSV
jgi:hypothetical protein